MKVRYYLQKLIGRLFNEPIIPEGKTVGYSMIRSERVNCRAGKHTRIYPPFSLHDVSIGDYTYIAKNSTVANCEIGKFCSIGANFCCGLGIHPTDGISTSPMFYSTAKQNGISLCQKNFMKESLHTTIGNDVNIGVNVTVLDGVSIGDGAIIGAGAVVTKSIPPYAIAVGVPATVKRYRFDEDKVKKLLERQWWNGSETELEAVQRLFGDVDAFLNL